jgi:phage terminase large subunit-like protein
MGGRRVESTNAYRRGQDSVAERSAEAAAKRTKGLLYDARPGDFVEDLTDRDLLLPALAKAYGDSSWVDLERIYEECNDPGVLPSDARRFYLSIPADEAEDECWLDPGMWEACEDYGVQLDPNGSPVYLGVDVSLKGDTTAVVTAQRQDDRWVVAARVWDPNESGVVNLEEVEAHIKVVASRFRIAGVAYDPKFFARSAQLLEDDRVPMVEVPQSHERMVPACGQAKHLIQTRQVSHPGDPVLTTQVLAAVPKFTESGWRLQKAKSRRKIDAAIALVLALDLASALEAPPSKPWAVWV